MAGETSGPNEQEVRMAALEHKFDDLLAFVHMMVKQVAEMGNQEWRRRAARFSENTPSGGEKWQPRACPLLDEKEMIKIFVDTLKNPYFDRIVGLQLQFLVDLILIEERIEDAVKTKRMVDMPALMALVEQIAKRTLVEKNEGGVQDDSQE
uniref:Uncharacterized protein n=1 Tax=Fagus sylvatica TaxID=28930 RepID=A0A2N9GG90_FAGSY